MTAAKKAAKPQRTETTTGRGTKKSKAVSKKDSAASARGATRPIVTHAGQELVAIDGGAMIMGTSVDDLLTMIRVVDPPELAEFERDGFGASRPPRVVTVAPFLIGRALADRGSLGLTGEKEELGLLVHAGGDLDGRIVATLAQRFYGLFGDHMLQAVGKMSSEQREEFLIDRFENAASAYPSSLVNGSIHRFVENHALPQVVAYPSERVARALVRIAGRGSMRQDTWKLIKASGRGVPAIATALGALGTYRELGSTAPPADVERFLEQYTV